MNSFPHILNNPSQWRKAPPSPFFETEDTDYNDTVNNNGQQFTREARTVEEHEDPEDYYNDWIMSNLG